MAKLKKGSAPETPAQSQVVGTIAQPATPAPANPTSESPTSFTTTPVSTGKTTSGEPKAGKPNFLLARKQKTEEAIKAGTPFTYDEEATNALRQGGPRAFKCICGSEGKHAHVLKDKNGNQVLVGNSCLAAVGVTAPDKPRKQRQSAPGVDRRVRMEDLLKNYNPPFHFVRKQEGDFTCACGGRGTKQVIVADANGTELPPLGERCASQVPGVELPKAQKQSKPGGAPRIAGLKGGAQPAAPVPDFNSVA